MKKLPFVVACAVFGSLNFYGSSSQQGVSEKSAEDFAGKGTENSTVYTEHSDSPNEYSLESLSKMLMSNIDTDEQAQIAMNLFLECDYSHLLDHLENHQCEMSDVYRQAFTEILVLLAPMIDFANYEARVRSIIGDSMSVTYDFFKHKIWCCDMCFYAAMKNAKCGKIFMSETFAEIYEWLSTLMQTLYKDEYKAFKPQNVRVIAHGGRRHEQLCSFIPSEVWPNLLDTISLAAIPQKAQE
jgi:hypothetical protein